MIANCRPRAMWGWAVRDLGRRPHFTLLLLLVLMGLTLLLSLWTLLGRSVSTATVKLMQQAPAVVIRRVSPMGWMPLPVDEALAGIGEVAGALNPRARVWGVVASSQGAVTVVGVAGDRFDSLPADFPSPLPGQALVGPGVVIAEKEKHLILHGATSLTLTVIARMPAASSMATHDIVAVHPRDARTLLGLQPHQASDLVLDVYHPSEIVPLCTELVRHFPWPVNIATRTETIDLALGHITRSTGIGVVVAAPAAAAFVLLVLALGAAGRQHSWETGLYKAMGWTGGDLMRLALYEALILILPALTFGFAAAYGMLYWPGVTWIANLFFGWPGLAPALHLSIEGVVGALVPVALIMGLPFFSAMLWTAWQGIRSDPGQLIQGGL